MIAGILVLSVTFAAIILGLKSWGDEYESIFHYYTVLSNMLSVVGAAFMIPYAAEGIRQKRFTLPRWIVIFQYCGAVGVMITMMTALLIILPLQGRAAATGMNFWLHLVTPVLTVSLFQCVESGIFFSWKDLILSMIPYWTYMLVYFIMVIVIGKENGGWEDIYYTQYLWPVWVSAILMLVLGVCVALLLHIIHNLITRQSLKYVSRMWRTDMEPLELKIEAFGLGRYMGAHCDESGVTVPLDIFCMMSERYGISEYELARAYMKGVCDMIGKKGGGQRGQKEVKKTRCRI